jgi:hypothetical protein
VNPVDTVYNPGVAVPLTQTVRVMSIGLEKVMLRPVVRILGTSKVTVTAELLLVVTVALTNKGYDEALVILKQVVRQAPGTSPTEAPNGSLRPSSVSQVLGLEP